MLTFNVLMIFAWDISSEEAGSGIGLMADCFMGVNRLVSGTKSSR